MLIDDDDNITWESPEEPAIYRRYERLQDKLRALRNGPTWPACREEFRRIELEAEAIYASLTNGA